MSKADTPTRPPITTDPAHLDNLVASYLAGRREPVTAAAITTGLTMTDYPSKIIDALNRLRAAGRVEADQRRATEKSTRQWHYWLSALPVAQPNAGDSATTEQLTAMTAERDQLATQVRSLTQRLAAAQRSPKEDELATQLKEAQAQLALTNTALDARESALSDWQTATHCANALAAAQKISGLNSRITELETQQLANAVGRAGEIERQWQTATGAASPEAARVYIEHMLRTAGQPAAQTDPTPVPRKNRPRPVEIIGAAAHGDSMLMLQFDRRLNSASAIVPRGQLGAAVMLGTKATGGGAAA